MEDRLSNKLPFAGGQAWGNRYPKGGIVFEQINCDGSKVSLEQQLKDALEREDYAKAIELRDKMKER